MSLLAGGFAATLGQVILLRELGTAWSGNELLYILGLAAWLGATSLGAAAAARRPGAPAAPRALGLALALPLGLVAARGFAPLLAAAGNGVVGLLAGSLLVMAPAAWFAGWLARLGGAAAAPGGPIRLALGAAGGGIAAGMLPATGITALGGVLGAGLCLLPSLGRAGPRWRGIAIATAALLVLAGLRSGPLDRALTAWSHPDLELTRETPRGRLVLAREPGGPVVRLDGAVVHRRARADDDLVHLAATQHPRPRSAVVLGGWLDGMPGRLAAYGLERIVAIEPDGEVLRLAGDPAPAAPAAPPAPGTVELAIVEPRSWLERSSERFDLILSALPEPLTVRANRFWTRQFADLCARRLRDGGILALQMQTGEQVWTLPQARRIAAIHGALAEVFAEVRVMPGTVTVLVAANRPLERNVDLLAARLRPADALTQERDVDLLKQRWHGHRTIEAGGILALATVPANSDLRPVCLADALLRDLGRVMPGLGWRELPQPRRWLTPSIVGGVLLALWLRRRVGASLVLVGAYAGLARTVATGVLLLYHQTAHGTLYRDLGFLLALVHLGDAAGVWLAHVRLPRLRTIPDGWRLPLLLVVTSLWSFVVTVQLLLGSGTAATGLWLAGTGLLTALVVAACRRRLASARLDVATPAGGASGALLAALLLLPLSGLPATTLTVTVLAFPAALAVWPLPGQPPLDPSGTGGRR